jgi:hypothetical protein
MTVHSISRAFAVAALLLIAACDDSATEPRPAPSATLSIAPPSATVYETDFVQFSATLRDASGNSVPGAAVAWEVSDPARAELNTDGGITALKPGMVTITARSNGATAVYNLEIARLLVQRVQVLPGTLELATGDITPVGVKVEGQGARTVPGRVVTISSDNPSVAYVDAAGRVRAVNPGTTTIRAPAGGVVGTAGVDVLAETALFALKTSGGARLPQLIESDSVMWDGVPELHEFWMESGTLRLSGAAQPRYELEIRYAQYKVGTVNGQRTMELRRLQREFDRGIVAYDARGDLQMTSEVIAPLSHTASAITGGFQVRYRIPGSDDHLELFYRRDVP